jgi:hypothetical protein
MNSSTLRQLWSVVEETQMPVLLSLNDTDLVQQLLHQLQHRHLLSSSETQAVRNYLSDRLSLIRDMAR